MGLIDIVSVKKEFLGEVLFEGVTFSVNQNDKVAIIGNNGVGKTTLLKMILNEIPIDQGQINVNNNVRIGYLSQVMIQSFDNSLYTEMMHAFNDVIQMENQLREMTNELNLNPKNDALLQRYGRLETLFLARGGYDYPYLIDQMISKFGFSKEDYKRPIKTFSGGERNKIAFSKLLLQRPDVLILDEPTNHLDLSTVEWLEEYLRTYEGAVLMVSHDRYFIDRVCNAVYEITNQKGEWYRGNYTYYLHEKVARYEQRLKAYQMQQDEIQRLTFLIQKFKPKPTKVAFAKDREKKLERILDNPLDKPSITSKKIQVQLKAKEERKVKQMSVIDLSYGYQNTPLSNPISMTIFNGDKITIIGDNGVGKTTLLKTLAGMIEPLSGSILHHRKLHIGYIDQNQIQIHSKDTVFEYFHNRYPHMTHYEIRSHLGSFLFRGEEVDKAVDHLSGGEKVRLSFALLVLKKYDILLLDEPTNHLDIDTKKILENTMVSYPGTIIFVSHDRYFIDELAEQILSIDSQRIYLHMGDYQNYLMQQSKMKIETTVQTEKKAKQSNSSNKSKKFDKHKIEEQIMQLEEELAHLHAAYEDPQISTNPDKLQELDIRCQEKENELQNLTLFYLENLDK